MKRRLLIFLLLHININAFSQSDFLATQKRYPRVRTIISEKENKIINRLKEKNIKIDKVNILMVVYKSESKLELFAKNNSDLGYKSLGIYDICSKSGNLGPKRKEGDYQVPEGFYFINRFNPFSNYYLSLGLNYPNLSDKRKSKAKKLGGDIFIHGNCVTIGCIPVTDYKIKEIYLYAINAKNNGQRKIPVYIFPFKMTDRNIIKYKNDYSSKPELIEFWNNLKSGYDKFINNKKELKIYIDKTGNYIFR